MNSVLSRANALFAFTLTVLACLTLCCFISTAFNDYKTNVDIATTKVTVKHVPDFGASREKNDMGILSFDIQADLTPLFNWNTKQLFLYLIAEYQTKNNVLNQVVLWDKIIERGQNAILDYKNVNPKYYFWDDGNGLKGNQNVTLKLSWNVIPNAGALPSIFGDGMHTFRFPNEYSTGRM